MKKILIIMAIAIFMAGFSMLNAFTTTFIVHNVNVNGPDVTLTCYEYPSGTHYPPGDDSSDPYDTTITLESWVPNMGTYYAVIAQGNRSVTANHLPFGGTVHVYLPQSGGDIIDNTIPNEE